MGIIPSMFKLRSYKVFDYVPRTYDPELERRRELLRQLREEQGKDMSAIEPNAEYTPGSIVRRGIRPRITKKTKKPGSYTIRLLLIIIFLFFVTYLILKADLTPIISLFNR